MPTLRELIADGRVHVFDGAMGTMLYAKGFYLNVCYDELSLRQPKLIEEVHAAYVRSGAEILETNTFGANPYKLAAYGLADETEKINQSAAEAARRAAGTRASVVGAIDGKKNVVPAYDPLQDELGNGKPELAYLRLPGPAGHRSRYDEASLEKVVAQVKASKAKITVCVFHNVDMHANATRARELLGQK